MICGMIPVERTAMPKFRSIWAAAEARFSEVNVRANTGLGAEA